MPQCWVRSFSVALNLAEIFLSIFGSEPAANQGLVPRFLLSAMSAGQAWGVRRHVRFSH